MNIIFAILLLLMVATLSDASDKKIVAKNAPSLYIQRYCYPGHNLKVVVDADTREEGEKKAARICFQALTGGRYPGEEKGLEIIDICANPRRCERVEE